MTSKSNENMTDIQDEELSGPMQPVVRMYAPEDLADVLYVLLLEAAEDAGGDLEAFMSLASPLRPDRLRHALNHCDRLIVATDLNTGRIIGVGGVRKPTNQEGEYWHIAFLSALNHENSDHIVCKLLSELEGWSFSSPHRPGLTIDAPRRMRPLLAHRGYSTIALSHNGDIATMAKQSDPEAYQNIPMSFLNYYSADASEDNRDCDEDQNESLSSEMREYFMDGVK